MSIYSIYRFTNKVNSKVYIGFTSNFVKRRSAHKKSAERGDDIKFYRAIRKHGWENFIFDIIYQSKDKEHTRDVMEPYFIAEYDSLKNGYNSTCGGDRASTVVGDTHHMKRAEQRKRQGNVVRGNNNPIHKLNDDKKKYIKERLFSKESIDKRSGVNHYLTDKRLHKFQNVITDEIVILTRYEFAKKFSLISGSVGAIITGKRKTTGGWKCLP
jgi:group I intron endonuclease